MSDEWMGRRNNRKKEIGACGFFGMEEKGFLLRTQPTLTPLLLASQGYS
jgi:hypothetical protein